MSSLALLFILFLSVSLPHLVSCKVGFSTDLIHRDSPKSPFYDPTLTPSDRLHASIRRSIVRRNQITTQGSYPMISGRGEYLMSVNFGSPPFSVMALVDTGSDLIWIQCQPCVNCYKQNGPIYDPSKSSTYEYVPCTAQTCFAFAQGICDSSTNCQYKYEYDDGTHTGGVLSGESFSIGNSAAVSGIVFGCAHDSGGNFDGNYAGIVGLGMGPLSLVSQMGQRIDKEFNKFSYCLAPWLTVNTSKIYFGESPTVSGNTMTTPLVKRDPDLYYTVELESVAIYGGKKFVVSTLTGVDDNGQGGYIVVDSGTPATFLVDSLLNPLINEISKMVSYETIKDPNGDLPLCYHIPDPNNNWINLPNVVFQFKDAPAYALERYNSWVILEGDLVCLAMIPTSKVGGGDQIFGNIAQQNHLVEYDVANREFSFTLQDCSQL